MTNFYQLLLWNHVEIATMTYASMYIIARSITTSVAMASSNNSSLRISEIPYDRVIGFKRDINAQSSYRHISLSILDPLYAWMESFRVNAVCKLEPSSTTPILGPLILLFSDNSSLSTCPFIILIVEPRRLHHWSIVSPSVG